MDSCACIQVNESTVQLETLLRHVAPSVPEIDYLLALDMLREAYKEFGRKTSLLVYHQHIAFQRGVRDYELHAPEGYEVYGLLNIDDKLHGYIRLPSVNYWFYCWGERFRMLDNKILQLETAPSRDYHGRHVALMVIPTSCADTIPTEIANAFGKGIAMGALADILEMPNKGWSNPRLAQIKRIEYNRTVLAGRNLHITNRGATSPRFKPVRIL